VWRLERIGPLIASPQAAVYVDRVAADEGRFVADQKRDQVGDIFFCTGSTDRGEIGPGLSILGTLFFGAVVFDRPRGNTVDPHPEFTKLDRANLGQHLNATFAGTIIPEVRKRYMIGPRANINNNTPPLLLHDSTGLLGTEKRPFEIGSYGPVEIGFAQFQQRSERLNRRIVDQNVDPASNLLKLFKHPADIAGRADVALESDSLAAGPLHPSQCFGSGFQMVQMIDGDTEAISSQLPCDLTPNSRAGTGDQGPAGFATIHSFILFVRNITQLVIRFC